jgi:hypothetical protein
MSVAREWCRLRAKGWNATSAYAAAKTLEAWNEAGGYVFDEGDCPNVAAPPIPDDVETYSRGQFNSESGHVRLRIVPDDCPDLSWADEGTLELANHNGMWGIVGEYFDGEAWQVAGSCWGFIGSDWKDSGVDTDIMQEALEALRNLRRCEHCGRPLKNCLSLSGTHNR